jgi:membrane protease YdiL (CAAX protease family)
VSKVRVGDSIFIFLFASLFFLVIINLLTGVFGFLFDLSDAGISLFALMSATLFLCYFFIWGAIRVENQFKGARLGVVSVSRILFSRTMNFIGLKKLSPKDSFYIFLSMIIGIVFNLFIVLALSRLTNGTLYTVSSPSLYALVQNLVVVPIFEELIFRGIYISVFLKLFGKTYASAGSALVLSSFTFGWIHPAQPIVKTIAGFLLGSIYLWGWKKNIAASSLAHFGANLIGTFLVLFV